MYNNFRPEGRIFRKGVRALPKVVNRGAKRGNFFSRSFFSYLDELS